MAERKAWSSFLTQLKSEPGIVLISAEQHGKEYQVYGLRDELAADSMAIARRAGVEPISARWETYQAMVPDFVLARAKAARKPPPTVTLALRGNLLEAAGIAPSAWITDAQKLAVVLPGIKALAENELLVHD